MDFVKKKTDYSPFINGKFSDIKVRVGFDSGDQMEFMLHRIVLAAESNFFSRKFDETDADVVDVKMAPKDFETCLNFMYSGHAIINPDDLKAFMAAMNILELIENIDHGSAQTTASTDDTDNGGGNAKPEPTPGPSRKRMKTEPQTQTKADPDEKKVNIADLNLQTLDDDKIKKLIKIDPDTNKPTCGLCRKAMSSNYKVFEHIRSVHMKRLSLKCPYCDLMFSTPTLRSNHVNKVHREVHQLNKLINS